MNITLLDTTTILTETLPIMTLLITLVNATLHLCFDLLLKGVFYK
jgi:hypothetical protein